MESLKCVTVLTKGWIRRRNDAIDALLQAVSVAQQAPRQHRNARRADGAQVLGVGTRRARQATQAQHIAGNQRDQSLSCSQLLK
jgi:ABC-type nitrate/sulfonate/bicarbonate transport system substrate-binding protein